MKYNKASYFPIFSAFIIRLTSIESSGARTRGKALASDRMTSASGELEVIE
jgi:hypothetical protein